MLTQIMKETAKVINAIKSSDNLDLVDNDFMIYSAEGLEYPDFTMSAKCPCCNDSNHHFLVLNGFRVQLHKWVCENHPDNRQKLHQVFSSFCSHHEVEYKAWSGQSTMKKVISCFPIASIMIVDPHDNSDTISRGYQDDLSIIIFSETERDMILYTPVFYQQFVTAVATIGMDREHAERFYYHFRTFTRT